MSDYTNEEENKIEEQELFEHYRFVAQKKQEVIRVDKFLLNMMDVSRNKIQMAAKAGSVLVNGKPVKPNYKIKPLDEISIVLPFPERKLELIPQNIPLQIDYEDDDLIIINKPAGMVVHPGVGNWTGTLVNALVYHFDNLPVSKNDPTPRPGLVHRIDKDTSGLMIIAKTESAKTHLAKQFFDRTVYRRYVALVWGDLPDDEGIIEGNIGRHLKHRKQMAVFPVDSEIGKPARTHYKVLERLGYVTLVECRLETGRTHQIRAHFQHIGHQLFNDERYDGSRIVKGTVYTKYKQFVDNCFKLIPRQALHAKNLGFIHPTTGKEMFFDSELPEDMTLAIDKWRRYMNR